MKKNLFYLIVAFAVVATFVSCDKEQQTEGKDSSEKINTTPAETVPFTFVANYPTPTESTRTDIANDGKTDKALEQISAHFDECMFGEYCGNVCGFETKNDCSGIQAGIDDLARVFSTSGVLPGLRGSVELHGDDDFFKCIYEWMGK